MRPSYLNSLLLLPLCLAGAIKDPRPGAAPAAWPLYCVYETFGNSTLKAADGKPVPLKKGVYIYQGQTLQISDDKSRVILFDQDTNYITLDKKGEYTTEAIQKYKKEHLKDGITAKYSAFFWEEFFKPRASHDPSHTEEMARSSGGVYRGNGALKVLTPAPDYATSYNRLPFRWRKLKGADSYTFRVTGQDGRESFEQITSDTSLMLRFPVILVRGDTSYWELRAEGAHLPAPAVVGGRLKWVDEYREVPKLNLPDNHDPGGLIRNLRLIELFEQNGCIREANSYFQISLAMDPGDRALKAIYRSFLKNNYIDHADHEK
jgi:hypothetical protein